MRTVALLMALSLVVLVGFCGQWLFSQYEREKDRLHSDLETVFAEAERQAMDSLLVENVLEPVLQERRALGRFPHKDMRIIVSRDMKYTVGQKPDSLFRQEISEQIVNGKKVTKRIMVRDTLSDRSIRFERHSDSSNILLLKGIQLLVNKVGGATTPGMEFLKTPAADSLRRERFLAMSGERGWGFDVRFLSHGAKPSQKNVLIVEATMLDFVPKLEVSGYEGYLFRQITPQMGFALLLVVLTGGAFLLAWKSLRRQMVLNTMKNDFISNMSHELKTPVATVKVALEAIDRFNVADNPQRTKEYLEMARLEMDRLELLVQQSLNTAMLESGKLAVAKEMVDVKSVAEGLVKMLQPRLGEASSKLAFLAAGSHFNILADRLHLQGVLMNLLDNALKYGGEGVQIEMKIREEAEAVMLEVTDSGPGIPLAYHTAVFDSYFRVPTGNQHNVKGYGLGLSYSRQAVERMGGSIRVDDCEGGSGCRFVIRFPKAGA